MSGALAKFFFRSPYVSVRTPGEIIGWWEARRPAYNAAIGATGIVTLTGIHLLSALPPRPHPMPILGSLAAAAVYGVLANICYSAGWLTELLVRKNGDESLAPVGPALFRYGFAFSVGLTLFPLSIAGIDFVFRIVRALFG